MFRTKLKNASIAITFNDLVLLPGFTRSEPNEIDLTTYFSKNIKLKIPFSSAPMDTVTGSELAIALALQGGIGILHRNCSAENEVEMAKKVKRAGSYIIRDVLTISPNQTIEEAITLMTRHNIHGLPVVDKDKMLIGIITWRDVRFTARDQFVKNVMTPREKIISANDGITVEKAKRILQEHRIEKLPIVDSNGRLLGLITYRDLRMQEKYPNSIRDEEGRLRVGAAISPFDLRRAKMLEPFVDVLVIDVAHAHNANVISAVKRIIEEVSVDVVVGNIGTYEAAEYYITKIDDVAGFRVGLGSGSICTTTVITRAFAPTLFATVNVADAVNDYKVRLPVIADGGIRTPGDIALALALGASAVMMGNIFAGCKESLSKLVSIGGVFYKEYYGMGSARAKAKRAALDRYSIPSKDIVEGVEGLVPYRGGVEDVVREFVAGLKAAMGYAGANNIRDMWEKARVAFVTPLGLNESKPHDIIIPQQKMSWGY